MPVGADDIQRLQGEHRGPVLTPDDPGYETARQSFNALINRTPPVIARPSSTADVSTAVTWARNIGLPVAVRGGGHSVAGHSICDDGLVVDLRLLSSVDINGDTGHAVVGGGATWRDVDTRCINRNLVMPGGTFDTTGVAGLTLSGGISHLLGVQGLTLDHLQSAEVVLPDGSVVVASEQHLPELFWALRGGGGNFGVVTSFVFALDPLPEIFGGEVEYTADQFSDVLHAYRSVTAAASEEVTMMLYAEEERVHVTMCSVGGFPPAEEAVNALRQSLPVARDRLNMTSYLQIQVMQGDTPFGLRHYWKSQFVDALSDQLIDEIVGVFSCRPEGSVSNILVEPLHGAATRVPVDATAFGRRQPGFNVSVLGHWVDAASDQAEISWVREGAARIAAVTPDHGGYLNYVTPDEPQSRVLAAFGAEKYARLLRLKQRLDPENTFRFNNNIRPI